MNEFHLRRRIPPLSVEELTDDFMNCNLDLSHYDAQALAVVTHAEHMVAIYKLARLGEAFTMLDECPVGEDLDNDYWRGYAEGWNQMMQRVRDNLEGR